MTPQSIVTETKVMTVHSWLLALSKAQPNPGGGAAGAFALAVSAALVSMVANYTIGPGWHDREQQMAAVSDEAIMLLEAALQSADDDATALRSLLDSYQMPDDVPEQAMARLRAIQQALVRACEPPIATVTAAKRLIALTETLLKLGNPRLISDVGVASAFARAALDAAIHNISINARDVADPAEHGRLLAVVTEATRAISDADRVSQSVLAAQQ